MREAALEFTRFLIAGAVNTVISYTAYLLLLAILPYLIAYAISYVVGIAISYLLLTRFVFRTQRRLSTTVRFPLVYAVQYLMGSIVLALLVERWGVRASIAAIVAIVASIPVTFLLSRFVLRPKS
jgi:putative flippase GtrA